MLNPSLSGSSHSRVAMTEQEILTRLEAVEWRLEAVEKCKADPEPNSVPGLSGEKAMGAIIAKFRIGMIRSIGIAKAKRKLMPSLLF